MSRTASEHREPRAAAGPGPASPASGASPAPAMGHRQVLEALSGLLLGMFVAILAGTVVSTSLPRIISDLDGDQTAYTWVVTATLLATTVTTPIWGKLADLFDRKRLIQLALVVFVVGSALAGLSQSTGMLIGFRVVQGLGAGGLTALSQVILADIISPRERGRYMGLFGGVMALGTVGGPLIGGLLTDSVGWRWNFYIGVPFAVAAIVVLQRTLKLPVIQRRSGSIDYLGAVLIAAGFSLLLIWVSLAGQAGQYDWISVPSAVMVGATVILLAAAVVTELRVSDPIIPLRFFRNRTFTFAVVASLAVGTAMFGTSVFLSQYMQLARGATPTESGLLTLPMIGGLLVASIVSGQLISRFGRWKPFMVVGTISLSVGLLLMSTVHYDTSYGLLSIFMFLVGAGVGMTMQNLVLVVQNVMDPRELGASSAGVSFFRSLGGTIGVSVLGSVLGSTVARLLTDRMTELRQAIASLGDEGAPVAKALAGGGIPRVSALPGPVRTVIESVYGDAVAHVFLFAVPLALLAIVAVSLLPNTPLGTLTATERRGEGGGEAAAERLADSSAAVAAETAPLTAPAPEGTGEGATWGRTGAGDEELPADAREDEPADLRR